MIENVVLGPSSVKSIAELIQISITPVFMLAGVSGFLNVFTGRLARIVDRLESINRLCEDDPDYKMPKHIQRHRVVLIKRIKNINLAILLMSATALLIAAIMITMFLGVTLGFDDAVLVSYQYMGAVGTFLIALSLFCREIIDTVTSVQMTSGFIP